MNLNEIIKSGANFTVNIGINDLKEWHREVIADTRRELEKVVLDDKAEIYLSAKQVCEKYDVDPVTLWRWAKRGYLVPIKVGGKNKYRNSDTKAILDGGKDEAK